MKKLFFSFLLLCTVTLNFAQGTYYDAINTNLPTFVDDLKSRIRSPYTKVSYDQYDETNIAHFAAQPNGTGGHYVTCVYSGYQYNYSGTFTWAVMSREHTWCQSWMPTSSSSSNEYSDQYHLFPTHQNGANGVRSNHPLGVVANVISSFYDSKYGTNTNGEVVFEPRNQHKGDAARAILYMALRYDDVSGNNWDFNWLNNVRLPSLSEAPQSLELLLQWAQADPPDAWEITRNNYIQSIQGNRNPFVDHPEYLHFINFYDMSYVPNGGTFAVEPQNYVSAFSVSGVTAHTISLSWVDAVAGTQAPTGYLLKISTGAITEPVDAITYPNDFDLSDGKGVINISSPSTGNITVNNLYSNTNYNIKIYSYNNAGGLINYKTDGTIPTVAQLTNSAMLVPEPSNQITNFLSTDVTSSSISVSWTDSDPGTQPAAGYILIGTSDTTIAAPVDGIAYEDDSNLADGFARISFSIGAFNQYVFNQLAGSTNYLFKIFPFNGAGDSINYKTDGIVLPVRATTLELTFVTNLTAGDIVIVGMNTDDPDEFAFVPLVNIASGVSISFTDNGWLASGSLRGGEGTLIWTTPANGVANGTIVIVDGGVSNVGTISNGGGSFALSTTGDQILAYTGAPTSPNFIYAVNDEADGWQSDATSSNTSALPAGLVNGVSAVALTEFDNLVFNGTVPADPVQIRLEVGNKANWIGSDDVRQTMPTGFWQLPVELINFSAAVDVNKVTLIWFTATELNNLGFEIQKLKINENNPSNATWDVVGFVRGKGNSTEQQYYSYIDISDAGIFNYRLKQIDFDGTVKYSPSVEVKTFFPDEYLLSQNYPNPFNPSTNIAFSIPEASEVTIKIFDMLGREVTTLINGFYNAGEHRVTFDASSFGGLSSGLYIYQLNAGSFRSVKKMNLLK
ncbi:MAG: endonuclease [Ignavibacteriaceae bacterium]|nr:endonuclease [Ignavibacteriaceae bacterium]